MKETLKLALEALEDIRDDCAGCDFEWNNDYPLQAKAHAAIKEALAQPEQEPLTDGAKAVIDAARAAMNDSVEAYDLECNIIISSELAASLSLCLDEYDRAIEAKLKEKNT